VDAIQTIQKDHRELDRLFESFERAARSGDAPREGALAREIVRELSVHAAIEEEFLYPALREAGVETQVLDALEEHHAAKVSLSEIEALPAEHERFASKVRVLVTAVRHHIVEEERELLPRLRRALDPQQLRQLGETLEQAKRAAPTRPHPQAPDTPPGVFVAGSFAALWDRLRDALRDGSEVVQASVRDGARRGLGAVRGLAGQAERRGRRAIGAATEELAQGAQEVVQDVRERGREAVAGARKQGRAAARTVRRNGASARQSAGRKTTKATGQVRSAAGAVKKGARRATRGYQGEPQPTVH
jgi:hemerythrin superfamily protein